MQYDKRDKLRYTIRGKKAFPVTTNGLFSFIVKGRYDLDKDFREVGTDYKSYCFNLYQNLIYSL